MSCGHDGCTCGSTQQRTDRQLPMAGETESLGGDHGCHGHGDSQHGEHRHRGHGEGGCCGGAGRR